jgi:hypothetical protein
MANNATGLPTDRHALFVQAQQTLGEQEFNRALAQAAVLPIAEQVIEEAAMRRILPIDRFDTGPAISYTMKKRSTAVVIPRYGAPPMFLTRYTRILVEPYIISHSPEISVIDIRDANFNIVDDVLQDAGKEIAVKEDTEGYRIFDSILPVPGGGWPSATTTITYSAGTGGIGTVLNTNVMQVGSSQTAPAGGVAGDVTVQNFLTVQAAMRQIGYEPDGVLINPYVMGKIAGQETFMLYLNFGTREVFEKGMLQNAFGLKLIQNRLVPQKSMYVMDTAEAARFIERDPLTVESSQALLMAKWFFWERICIFVRNANAIFRIAIDS